MNVKPKDLAMVVNAPAPWSGLTGTVLRPFDNTGLEEFFTVEGPYWLVEMARPIRTFSISRRTEQMSLLAYWPDSMLRKIGGPDVETRSFDEMVREVSA